MITSIANQKVKDIQKLQKSSKYRSQEGLFVVEGKRMVADLPPHMIEMIYYTKNYENQFEGISSTEVTDLVMKAMSNDVTPQGVLAVVRMPQGDLDLSCVDNPLILALDCVQDPGNLGTIIRTAEAAGADMVVLSKGTVDLYNPKVVKGTMGALCRMKILRDVDLASFIVEYKEKGIRFYAAHLKGKNNHFEEVYLKGTCFLMGNEGNGLSEEIAALADTYIRIPMKEEAESLNVAMATGILLYEAVRQRQQ